MSEAPRIRSTRPMLSPEFLARVRRRRLTDALAEVCAERGYRATTVADIVAGAHTARNSFYQHFANKEEVFVALLERSFDELWERVEAACQSAPPGQRRVQEVLRATLEWVEAEPLAARAWLVESWATPRTSQMQLQASSRFSDLLRRKICGDAASSELVAELMVGGVVAVLRRLLLAGEGDRASDLLANLVLFCGGRPRQEL